MFAKLVQQTPLFTLYGYVSTNKQLAVSNRLFVNPPVQVSGTIGARCLLGNVGFL